MALKDEWIKTAKGLVDALNTSSTTPRKDMKELVVELAGMKPSGLKVFELGSEWLTTFAKAVRDPNPPVGPPHDFSAELRPFVSIYAAAAGATATFVRVLNVWIYTPDALGGGVTQKDLDDAEALVNQVIEYWFELYTATVVK